MFKRPVFQKILSRLKEPRKHIQVLVGPRQVGKTTLAHQLKQDLNIPITYASADEADFKGNVWIEQIWESERIKSKNKTNQTESLLIFDEIQKISQWSTIIKRLWDEDTQSGTPIKIMLLGSSSLLIQEGLSESLAGRFEAIPITHWTYNECREAFDFSLEQYIYFGGYPGASGLIKDENRWKQYILNSLIETTISKDILLMERIQKPALLKRMFELGCHYSGQILSYNKMLGQLQDAGNTVTLAHYLDLLSGAGLVTGLQKYTREVVRKKTSSPKLQVLNTALMSAQRVLSFEASHQDGQTWGRLVESAVGAHLFNTSRGTQIEVDYWREGNFEVDFILRKENTVLPIEVKSTLNKTSLPGIKKFTDHYPSKRTLLVGGQGISLEEFLLMNPQDFF